MQLVLIIFSEKQQQKEKTFIRKREKNFSMYKNYCNQFILIINC